MLPHAVRELTELGLADRLAATGDCRPRNWPTTPSTASTSGEPRGLAAGYHWPQFSIHRGELQMILLDAARERLGADACPDRPSLAVRGDDADGVRAHFVDRRSGDRSARRDGDVLIGADGIHSAVRAQPVSRRRPPIWNGAILWRGITLAAALPDRLAP